MALKEEYIKTGNWLFKWRSYMPLYMIIIIIAGLLTNKYLSTDLIISLPWKIICMGISFSGLFIRILAIGYAPRGTSGRNVSKQEASQLNSYGIYSTVRHPLYLGNFMIWFGISLFFQIWWLSLLFILLFWIYYERIMFAEEEFLRQKFGKTYTNWASKIPAFFPSLTNYKKNILIFSMKNVLKREYSAFFGIITSFVLMEFFYNYYHYQKIFLDRFWLNVLGIGLFIYLLLRTLKRKTKILHVSGR